MSVSIATRGCDFVNSPAGMCVTDLVRSALSESKPVVALESAVLTHGLPYPANIEALSRMTNAVTGEGAWPALCLTHGGRLWVGAEHSLAEQVATDPTREKVSVRDIGRAVALKRSGGLTVSATLHACAVAGIHVFATGGIGGVHTGASDSGDISADLLQLSRCRVVTVCSGAKSVLDIPRTLEFLEMAGVPVYGYQTSDFPAFYLTRSGMRVSSLDSPDEIACVAHAGWALRLLTSVVLGNPVPHDFALPPEKWTSWLDGASAAASRQSISGKEVTPFLLAHIAEASGGRAVESNLALLESNARLAARVAVALAR